MKDAHRGKVWGETGNTELLCPLESGCVTFPAHQYVHRSPDSTELWCPEILVAFHYVGMTSWANVLEFTIQILPFPGGWAAQIPTLQACGGTSWWLVQLAQLNLCKGSTGSHCINTAKTLPLLREFQGL